MITKKHFRNCTILFGFQNTSEMLKTILKIRFLRPTKAVNLQADMTLPLQGPGMLQSGQKSFHYVPIWMVPIMKLNYFKIHFSPNTNTAANMWQPTEVLSQLFGKDITFLLS